MPLALLLSLMLFTTDSRAGETVKPLNRPTAAPPFTMEDWFGERVARIRIGLPAAGKPSTVVITADDLDLSDRKYSFRDGTAPKNVIIIADTLRLTALAQFDLSGKPSSELWERSGGQLAIFARRVVCSEGARIVFKGIPTFYTTPFNPPASPGTIDVQNVPWEGNFFFGAESIELSEALKENILQRILQQDDLLPQTTREPLNSQTLNRINALIEETHDDQAVRGDLRAFIQRKNTFDSELIDLVFALRTGALERSLKRQPGEVFQKYLASAELSDPSLASFESLPKPRGGIFRTAAGAEAIVAYVPDFKLAISEWAVRWLQAMARRIKESRLKNDRGDLYQAFYAVEHFPRFPIDSTVEDRYSRVLEEIRRAQSEVKLGLTVESVSTTTVGGALPIQIDAYAEGTSLDYRVAPTTLLLRETTVDGVRKLGLLRADPAQPDELEFYVTADLSVDPALGRGLADYFGKLNFRYAGMFSKWNLYPIPFDPIPGLVSEKSTISINGTILQAKLVFSKSGIGLIQWSTAGLPVKFRWEYVNDPKIGGELRHLLLKRTTRAEPQLLISDGTVTNNSRFPVRIRYLLAGDTRVLDLSPQFLEVDVSKSAPLPVPAGVNIASVKIPAEAVEYVYRDVRDYGQDFYISNADQLVEEVTLTNELKITGVPGKGAIESINITLTYDTGGGLSQQWSTQLLPSPSPGAVAKHWFFRDRSGDRKITVSGRIHYTDGGFDDLKPATVNTQVVRVGLEMVLQSVP